MMIFSFNSASWKSEGCCQQKVYSCLGPGPPPNALWWHVIKGRGDDFLKIGEKRWHFGVRRAFWEDEEGGGAPEWALREGSPRKWTLRRLGRLSLLCQVGAWNPICFPHRMDTLVTLLQWKQQQMLSSLHKGFHSHVTDHVLSRGVKAKVTLP